MNYNSLLHRYNIPQRLLWVFFLVGTIYNCKKSTKNQLPVDLVLERTQLTKICDSIYEAYSLPGLAIAIRYGEDEFVFSKGIADQHMNLPVTDSTLFYMGSFSEVPMTMAMLELEEAGLVDLDIPFRKYIPYLDKEFDGVQPTIHHLLTHTSGIEDTNPTWDDTKYDTDELEMTSKSIAGLPLLFEPGSKRTWCGYGFDILADIMQKTTGEKFEHLLDSLVLEPMDIQDATFEIRKVDIAKLAKPQVKKNYLAHTYKNGDFYPYARENAGSHGFHSSLSNMLKLFTILIDQANNIFQFEYKELFKRQYQTSNDTYTAYGWQVLKVSDSCLFEHSWRQGGFSGSVLIEPENSFAMVIITNTVSEFVPATYTYNFWKNVIHHKKIEIKPPYQIAMGKQLSEGKTLEKVLKGYELEYKNKESGYSTPPEILAEFYSNLVMEEKIDLAEELKDYLQTKHPEVYNLVEPIPVD
ncbi:serine hydrolase domain-containing protein [Flagellimonas flava]|uniref:CubicO group peptidase, beta-lactamase class C family n=1 Tax=Flagellimonas flava TaxID=570519 RepID=A0A1M5NN38_9FLAO|nr:serine hydrolase domain-containing protein [Allomuricauda flava]SHG90599.1 CubicO group peptidase, beta-lactamase class C family [Allomuricauda flava]